MIAIGVIVLLLVKVIPVFEKMFADFGGTLPGPTQMVIELSHWLQAYIVYMLVGVVRRDRVFAGAKRSRASATARTLCAQASGLRQHHQEGRGGALHADARDDDRQWCADSRRPRHRGEDRGQHGHRRGAPDDRAAISEGKTIAEPLQDSKVFPGMVVQMIAVGEETGSMETMLTKIADFYDDEVDAAVDALTALLEPIMMVFLGGSIGAILIAMYLPIFTIADTIT